MRPCPLARRSSKACAIASRDRATGFMDRQAAAPEWFRQVPQVVEPRDRMSKRACVVVVGVTLGLAGTASSVSAQLPVPTPPPVPTVPPVPTAPPVPAPSLPAAPQVPDVQAPSVPAPSTGSPSAPSVPGTGGGSGSRDGSGSGSGSGGQAEGQAPASGGAGDQGSLGTGGSAGSPGSGGSGGSDSGSGRADPQESGARVVKRERRLRRVVRRLERCLSVLPPLSTRVLALRAGLGAADPLSRGQVARRLDRPARAVGRIERRGVERLRRALRNGSCAPAGSAPGGTGAAGTGSAGAATPGTAGAADGADGSAAGSGDGQALPGGGDIGSRVSVKGESEDNLGPFGMFSNPPATRDITVFVLLALLALAGLGAWWLHRRRTT